MNYRKEIDGLRAVAVLSVVLFHAGLSAFSGGYVGVDVFFVISGYLITTILLDEVASGRFSIVTFYERRARRILPALFFVLAACLPFAWLWLLPSDLENFSRSLVAVCLFVSNVFFNATSGYFETTTELKPLLHTWSLAVEEQFYVLFPLLLILLARWHRVGIAIGLAALALPSLLLAQWGSASHVGFTYFLLPTRAWELIIGALGACAIGPGTLDRSVRLAPRGSVVRQVLGVAGLGLICAAVVLFDRETPFPSFYALVPTVGALLILLFATQETWVGQLLGLPLFVGLGLVSYSAYLWHQPLFAFAKHRLIDVPSKGLLLGLGVAAFALAYASWRFVEKPFRDRKKWGRGAILALGLVGSASFIALGVVGAMTHGFPGREPVFAKLGSLKTVVDSRCHGPQRRSAAQIAVGDFCTLGDAAVKPSFAVLGDSHAAALFEALGRSAAARHLAFQAVSGGFCPPLAAGFRLNRLQDKDCLPMMRAALDHVRRDPEIKTVVLFAEWANYALGQRDEGEGNRGLLALASDDEGKAQTASENSAIFRRSLVKTINDLQRAGKQVVIVEPTPEFDRNVLPAVAKQWRFNAPAFEPPVIRIADYEARNSQVFDAFAALHGIASVRTRSLFCSEETCRATSPKGDILFSDTNHPTEVGAKPVAEAVMTFVDQAAK